jgi:hypothetical protein
MILSALPRLARNRVRRKLFRRLVDRNEELSEEMFKRIQADPMFYQELSS